jgi:hypothetical protein
MDAPARIIVEDVGTCATCKDSLLKISPITLTMHSFDFFEYCRERTIVWYDHLQYCRRCASSIQATLELPKLEYQVAFSSEHAKKKNHMIFTLKDYLSPTLLYVPCTDRCGTFCKGQDNSEHVTDFNYKIILRQFKRCGHCASAHNMCKNSHMRWPGFDTYNYTTKSKKILMQFANCIYASVFPQYNKEKIISEIQTRLSCYARVAQCPDKHELTTSM